jgi:hypothetical protein
VVQRLAELEILEEIACVRFHFFNSPSFAIRNQKNLVIPDAPLRAIRDPSRSGTMGPGSARLTPLGRDDRVF